MAENEMVEKVARAICASDFDGDEKVFDTMSDEMRQNFRINARAAIEAMRGEAPIWGDESGAVRGFMDKVDFECELGGASGGNCVYPSEEDCAEHCSSHIDQCGMVEVEVRLVRVVRPGNLDSALSH